MDNRIDAIYGRQSIDKKDSISIESQFEFCRYELKGGEGREYKDKGYSGKNIERPDFQRLLQDIKLGLIKRVIVYKLDRISRSIVDFAKLMELFKQYNVEFVSCTEKFDTSTPMGRAMLNICIVFAQLERESIQMRVQDAFYSRCTKGYYMRGRTPYGFDTEPIVMDGIKTKKLVENAEMDFAELMFQMYAEPSSSYGDITRYFVKNSIEVYGKALQRAFISKLLRNPVYVQADMDIYEYFKAQGVKIESPPEMFTGDNSCYLYQGREGEEQILVIAPHQGRIPSSLWLTVQRKLSQNTSFQNGRKCHNTWLAGKIKCGRCGYALVGLRAQNGVTYLRCKQRADNGSCEGAGTLTAQSMESFVYGEMVEKMRKYATELVTEVKASDKTYRHDNQTRTPCPDCGKYLLRVKGKRGEMLVCPDRECGYRRSLTQTTNARCPNCHKKMELRGEGEKQMFACVCGYREKLSDFKKRRASAGAGKRDVRKYLANQDTGGGNTAMADALAKWKAAQEAKNK